MTPSTCSSTTSRRPRRKTEITRCGLVSPARSVRWGACRAGWCRGGGQRWSSPSRGAGLSELPAVCLLEPVAEPAQPSRVTGRTAVEPGARRSTPSRSRPAAARRAGGDWQWPGVACVCHCWLPSRLPDIWFPSLTFARSKSVPSRQPKATVSTQLDPVRVTARTALSRLPRLRSGLALLNLCPLFIPVLYRITPPCPGQRVFHVKHGRGSSRHHSARRLPRPWRSLLRTTSP